MTERGFIDLHTHGIGRYETRTKNPAHLLKIAELHGKAGTAGILPAIYPGSLVSMRENLEAVRRAMFMQGQQKADASALLLGVHLEGPLLNPKACGALDKKSFKNLTPSSFTKLIAGYEDIIKIMTVAPEMPGALKVIEKCAELGIRVNMGHSHATYDQAVEGKKAGATGITHIFNAMSPFHHREPGLAGLGLIDEDLYIEVIADGMHLHPKTLELIFNRKRLDRIILVSDSVKGGKQGIPVYHKKGVLAGSGITLSVAIAILGDIGIPDGEIIEAARDNPARYIGLRGEM